MEVEQKHITTIRMHDAKGSDVAVTRDGDEYQLRLTSSNRMVVVTLGRHDLHKLCQQLVRLDLEENWKGHYVPPPEVKSFFLHEAPRSQPDPVASWFLRVAGEVNEKACRQ
jgi:hypothetical protein